MTRADLHPPPHHPRAARPFYSVCAQILSPHRFKNVVYSPNAHNAYGAQKFPALMEALAANNTALARMELDVVRRHVLGAASTLLTGSGAGVGDTASQWSCATAFDADAGRHCTSPEAVFSVQSTST